MPRPFGLFLEQPLPLWYQIYTKPKGWWIGRSEPGLPGLDLPAALRQGQAR